jgi:hypothetical protein
MPDAVLAVGEVGNSSFHYSEDPLQLKMLQAGL